MRTNRLFAALGICAIAACSDNQGKSGALTLVELSDEFASTECPNGGQRIDAGRDANRNASLDEDEITSSSFVCSGAQGANGADAASGMDGPDGADGPDGVKGPDVVGDDGQPGHDGGLTAVNVTHEAPGDACAAGGQRIEIGPDANGDGVIDAGSSTETAYVCDGVDGASGTPSVAALVLTSEEAPGAQCQHGGTRIDYGADADGNSSLDPGELEGTRYVCDGSSGSAGTAPVFAVSVEPVGANCAYGGKRVDYGQDEDADGELDASEVTGTQYTCDGATGGAANRSLVDVAAEAAGGNCATGGQQITHGLDDDGDGTLAAGEIDGTRYVCNGGDGTDSALVLVAVAPQPPGGNCTGGGQKVTVGLDDDSNETLDAAEVDSTSYVCDFDEFLNGSFELPDYQGWTVNSTSSGQWLLITSGTTLQSGQTWFDYADRRNETINSIGLPLTVASTHGTKVAVQLQLAPGIHRIYQDFTVPLTATTLKWDMYYKNTWNTFTTNQYIAVNVRDPLTDAVIATLYKTTAGAPLNLGSMLPFTADLSAFAGTDIRFDIETNIQLSWIDVVLDNFVIQ